MSNGTAALVELFSSYRAQYTCDRFMNECERAGQAFAEGGSDPLAFLEGIKQELVAALMRTEEDAEHAWAHPSVRAIQRAERLVVAVR